MASKDQEYDVNDEIAAFFLKTSVRREACDVLAKELVSSDRVIPVAVQGACSYTVYAGPNLDHVVQFRLKSLELKKETAALARQIFAGKESLLVYVMTRMRGMSHLDFILAHGFPENSGENMAWRKNLIQDVARFFTLAWKAPQEVDQAYRDRVAETFEKDLQILLGTLPERFHPIIRHTLTSLPIILSLPMTLIHEDFGGCNIMVEEKSCHLVGVVDWAEVEIAPFGTNLYSLQNLMSKLHLKNGQIRYSDYDDLNRSFWETFSDEVGGLDKNTIKAIKAVRVLGLLRSRGFTSRLGNMPEPVPITDDENGRYNMMILDGLLLNPSTRFEGLNE
ncbi:hypothetical protein GGR58DRAFT_500422 [Xylaria digitata]|nr:hypothetical protein GGR58DRAFT_500422 [Xylaria digitata]